MSIWGSCDCHFHQRRVWKHSSQRVLLDISLSWRLVWLSSGEPGPSSSSHWPCCSPSACCFTPWELITPRCRRPSLNARSILMSRWTTSAGLTRPLQEMTANGGPGGSGRTILTRRIEAWLPWHPQTSWLSGRWWVQPLKSCQMSVTATLCHRIQAVHEVLANNEGHSWDISLFYCWNLFWCLCFLYKKVAMTAFWILTNANVSFVLGGQTRLFPRKRNENMFLIWWEGYRQTAPGSGNQRQSPEFPRSALF